MTFARKSTRAALPSTAAGHMGRSSVRADCAIRPHCVDERIAVYEHVRRHQLHQLRLALAFHEASPFGIHSYLTYAEVTFV